MRISIYSIEQTLYEGVAEKLVVKTPSGEIAILENHLPIISRVSGPDAKVIDKDGKTNIIKIASGFLEVRPDSSSGISGSHAVILAE